MKRIIYSSKELFLFALPIIFGQVGQMLISAGDTLVAARFSTDTVAAIGLAGGVISPLFVAGLGFIAGLSPILAKRRGEGDDPEKYLITSLAYSLVVALAVQLITLSLIPFVKHFGMDDHLVPLVSEYIFLFSFSFWGAYIFQGLKEFLQSFEDVVIPNSMSIVAVFFNIGLNVILVNGYGPVPEMGIKGLAYASIIIRTLLAFALIIYAKRYFSNFKIIFSFIPDVLRLSIPIAFTVGVEVGAFCVSTIIIGNLGTLQTAAHNLVLTLASITFMVPLAISSAVSVKVGHAYGEKNYGRILQFTKSSLFLSLVFMGTTGLTFSLFPSFFMELFTNDLQVISIGVPLLYLVAIFQLCDGAQITLTGILRGLGETKIVFILILIAYWVIGIPGGIFLSFKMGLNAKGMWVGLTTGLFLIAFGLITLLKLKMTTVKKEICNQ